MIARKVRPQQIIFGTGLMEDIQYVIQHPITTARNVGEVVGKIPDLLRDGFTAERYPGEHHAKVGLNGQPYSFIGPGTNLTRRINRRTGLPKPTSLPRNRLDADAMRHDIRYGEIADQYYQNPTPENKRRKMAEIHQEDQIFIDSVNRHRADDPVVAVAAENLIKLKKIGEQYGILDSRKFSGFGKKQRADPAKKLRDLVLKSDPKPKKALKQNGGFLPALAVPVVASVLSTLTGKIFDLVREKIRGSGVQYKIPFKYYTNKKKFLTRLQKAQKRITL